MGITSAERFFDCRSCDSSPIRDRYADAFVDSHEDNGCFDGDEDDRCRGGNLQLDTQAERDPHHSGCQDTNSKQDTQQNSFANDCGSIQYAKPNAERDLQPYLNDSSDPHGNAFGHAISHSYGHSHKHNFRHSHDHPDEHDLWRPEIKNYSHSDARHAESRVVW